MTTADSVPALRAAVLEWYRAHRRDLPWRRTRDPYAVWISEIMLQQTRVDTVIPYFERFLERWPDVQALAGADPDDVRAAWSGLGYYRRARLMLACAAVVANEHEGRFPDTAEGLAALPGFGRYTAGAVASIAFDEPAPAVDGNVSRVLARLHGIEGDVTKGAAAKQVWARAAQLAPGEAPGDLTQGLIELGALVCATKSPRCAACPVADVCVARREGKTAEIPPPRKRAARKAVHHTALVVTAEGRVLLEKQPDTGLFASLWCPPLLDGELDPAAAADEAARKYGFELSGVVPAGRFTHVLTHRDLHIDVAEASLGAAPSPLPDGLAWAPVHELEAWAIPSVTAKILSSGLPSGLRARARMGGRRTRRRQAQGAGQIALPLDE